MGPSSTFRSTIQELTRQVCSRMRPSAGHLSNRYLNSLRLYPQMRQAAERIRAFSTLTGNVRTQSEAARQDSSAARGLVAGPGRFGLSREKEAAGAAR